MAHKKFPTTARGDFKKAVRVLQEIFEPESRRDLYLAEFQTRCKGKGRELAGIWRGFTIISG